MNMPGRPVHRDAYAKERTKVKGGNAKREGYVLPDAAGRPGGIRQGQPADDFRRQGNQDGGWLHERPVPSWQVLGRGACAEYHEAQAVQRQMPEVPSAEGADEG